MKFLALLAVPSFLLGSWMTVTPNGRSVEEAERTTSRIESSADAFRLMSAERDAMFRALVPKFEDEQMTKLLKDPNTLFYTEREIPKAYQQWDGALPGVHSAHYNISADNNEPYGNGNLEFPWGTTAGTHLARNVESVKFLSLPRDENGQPYPVVWWSHHYAGDDRNGYAWVFPMETVVGEILMMKSPQGERIPFEVRIRKRTRYDWEVDVFRPFPTDQDLVSAIQSKRSDWDQDVSLKKLVQHLQAPNRLEKERLSDGHPRLTFNQAMGVDQLPAIQDDALVTALLRETPFKSAHGVHWAESGERYAVAPTTRDSYHIVPARYTGGFIDVDETSCLRCHDTVGKHVRNFDYTRDWYGRIRGSDGIFSFHPFSPGSVSHNGQGVPVSMRGELVKAGIVAKFEPKKHPQTRYRRLSFLGE